MDVVTLIEAEVDGKLQYVKVKKDEFLDCADRTGWAFTDPEQALDQASNHDIEMQCWERNIELADDQDYTGWVPEDSVAKMLHDVYINQVTGHDFQNLLNKLYREYLGREL